MRTLFLPRIICSFLLTMAAASAFGFDSYPTGPGIDSNHDEITNAATSAAGVSDELDDLQEAIRQPDWDETNLKLGPDFLKPNSRYRADHHFDRPPGITSEEAFLASATYYQREFEKAVSKASAGRYGAAVAAMGRAMHALQDFVSHSNLIDLNDSEASTAIERVFDELAPGPPATLQLTGYDPNAADPGDPPGDTYGHDNYSKDRSDRNNESEIRVGGRTKYELAKEKAIQLSTRSLMNLKSALGNNRWNKFVDEAD